MPQVEGEKKLYSLQARKRFGFSQDYGSGFYGYIRCGEDNPFAGIYQQKIIRKGYYQGYGTSYFGYTRYGQTRPPGGVFEHNKTVYEKVTYKEKFYWSANPNTVAQQTRRNKFKHGMSAWSALTSDQKLSWKNRAESYQMNGSNLFLRYFLKV